MKTINIKSFLLSSVLLATTFSCVDDSYDTPNLDECVKMTVNKQVTDFTSIAAASYTKNTTNDFIEAYVTSSDEAGNFYKSISFVSVDGNTGFSIPVDQYNLYTYYEPGRKVYIDMKNRYFALKDGSTIIGDLYNNETPADLTDDAVGRISGAYFKDALKRSCDKVNEDVIVNKNLTIAQAKNNIHLNKLIEFDGVQFTDASNGKKYFDPSLNNLGGATNHEIIDAAGNKIVVRVSEFASFNSDAVSMLNGKIRGVLTKFGSTFQFMVRTKNDIKLTAPRIVPLLDEPFTTNFPNWTKFSVIGAQTWATSTSGNPGTCAQMSGFSGGNLSNEDWLISPAINLTGKTSAKLGFDNASRFAGDDIKVYVSTNYSGTGTPVGATWTEITGFTLDLNETTYVWTASGLQDISAYVGGNVYVAFKYTSDTTASSTWRIDNVRVVAQ